MTLVSERIFSYNKESEIILSLKGESYGTVKEYL
ncbi:hypothetical protein J2S05_002412 [Alkalicoccobacillus murimartini]|uniref:Uncharacterized protein n=1 Tax=Alkalicoccobacillus murimartini TaxID=171685 RepID=A0ABT9YIS2_9BACI|nr:hypothetical protein [Alkalicoccobacillus murimartini]